TIPDDRVRSRRIFSFALTNDSVTVLVDAAPAGQERQRAASGWRDCECPEWSETAPNSVDQNGGDPVLGHRGDVGQRQVKLFVSAATMLAKRYRPTARRLRTGRKEQIEVDLVHGLNDRVARARSDCWNVLAWMDLIIRRDILAEGDRGDG